jgi:hypothetical protein
MGASEKKRSTHGYPKIQWFIIIVPIELFFFTGNSGYMHDCMILHVYAIFSTTPKYHILSYSCWYSEIISHKMSYSILPHFRSIRKPHLDMFSPSLSPRSRANRRRSRAWGAGAPSSDSSGSNRPGTGTLANFT